MIPAEVHHIPSQECTVSNIQEKRRICQYVPSAGNKMHMILVDEADRMSDAAQVALLSQLDSTNFPPDTIFIFTCNDSTRLEPRFLSRLPWWSLAATEWPPMRLIYFAGSGRERACSRHRA